MGLKSYLIEKLKDNSNESVSTDTNIEGWGSSGTEMFAGALDEEEQSSLTGSEGAKVYDRMERRDYQVKMNLLAAKAPIKGAKATIVPAGDEQWQIDDAEFAKFLLFEDMTPDFDKFLSEQLSMIGKGFCLHEMVDKIELNHPKWKRYIGIKKMAFRSQKTIEKWNVNKETKELESVHQMAFGDFEVDVNIPAEYLIRVAIDDDGDNYEGISMLRPCYGPYVRKEVALKVNIIGIEKFAVPTPIGTTPETGTTKEQMEEFKRALKTYISHQSGYIVTPFGYDVELKNSDYDPEKVDKAVDSEDRRSAKAFLANFLELGIKGGSKALSTDLSDFFLKGIQYIANGIISKAINKIIKRYIDLNFGPRESYPTIEFSGIEDKPGSEFASALATLINAGAVTPDEGIEENARKRYNLPKKLDDDPKKIDPKKKVDENKKPKLSDKVKESITRRVKELTDKRS